MCDTTTGNTYVLSEFLMYAPHGPPRRVLIKILNLVLFSNFSEIEPATTLPFPLCR